MGSFCSSTLIHSSGLRSRWWATAVAFVSLGLPEGNVSFLASSGRKFHEFSGAPNVRTWLKAPLTASMLRVQGDWRIYDCFHPLIAGCPRMGLCLLWVDC